ncbi:RBBP9/YdeN family alpha/beta hydrolase [Glutamicibacter halophytocola]|uniref:Alpha/beta hydrolase n=1 Tax=Glutamicibacter halophytocola TaxID=1933880 RepID=A0AA94XTY1_9MICC|nr:alpha/beta hydrolase [Glutamicibacter halophytocola]ALG29108.1 alpha/beta hydrolase [Glutamicibacter halophytocola]UUX57458.1 alpha/beta hydrolase [Glutamicibacter halophytocola]
MTTATLQTPSTTQQRAVIFHGYGATPEDHWFGWLAEQLEAENISTAIPALQSPLDPCAVQWENNVRSALKQPNEHTIAIAHSLGCLSVLRYLRSLPGSWRLGTLVLVSGFIDRLPILPELNDFIGDGCDLTGFSEHIDRIVVIRSDNDSIVPPTYTDDLAGRLGVSAQVVIGAGHFLADEGIIELPHVRDTILSLRK